MTDRPLVCTKCGSPCEVVEDVTGFLDWGPAVVGDDGIVRPANPAPRPPVLSADNAGVTGRPRACCSNAECRHQWTLRRRFDPAA